MHWPLIDRFPGLGVTSRNRFQGSWVIFMRGDLAPEIANLLTAFWERTRSECLSRWRCGAARSAFKTPQREIAAGKVWTSVEASEEEERQSRNHEVRPTLFPFRSFVRFVHYLNNLRLFCCRRRRHLRSSLPEFITKTVRVGMEPVSRLTYRPNQVHMR